MSEEDNVAENAAVAPENISTAPETVIGDGRVLVALDDGFAGHMITFNEALPELRLVSTLSQNTSLEGSPDGMSLRSELEAIKSDLLALKFPGKPLPYHTELDYSYGPPHKPLRMEIEDIKSELNMLSREVQWLKETMFELSKNADIIKEAVEAKKISDALVAALQTGRRIIQPKI